MIRFWARRRSSEDLLGVIGENTPGRRDGDLGPQSLEQGGVQLLLQLPHLRADGGLCPKTRLRRLGEALEAHDLEKCMELIEVHTDVLLGPSF